MNLLYSSLVECKIVLKNKNTLITENENPTTYAFSIATGTAHSSFELMY